MIVKTFTSFIMGGFLIGVTGYTYIKEYEKAVYFKCTQINFTLKPNIYRRSESAICFVAESITIGCQFNLKIKLNFISHHDLIQFPS